MNGWTEISGDKTKKFNFSALLSCQESSHLTAHKHGDIWKKWLVDTAGYCWYFRIWQWSCQRRPGLYTTIPTTKGTNFAVWPSLTIILIYPPKKTYSFNQLCYHPAGWKPQGSWGTRTWHLHVRLWPQRWRAGWAWVVKILWFLHLCWTPNHPVKCQKKKPHMLNWIISPKCEQHQKQVDIVRYPS